MQTALTRDPETAAAYLKQGGIVAFPTETVYGLGANVFNAVAVAKVFEAKRRPADNPLIAHVADFDQINLLASEINETAQKLIEAFFPGPLTLVLAKGDSVPLIATAGLDTIGVRMPQQSVAQLFLKACGFPVVAPSANLSGRPSPTTWQAVLEDLDGRIDCILQGDPTEIGLESTVVDCTGDVPVLLRLGSVPLSELRNIIPQTIEYKPVTEEAPMSPGLKHKHYAPRARVFLAESTMTDIPRNDTAYIGMVEPSDAPQFSRVLVCSTVEEYAHWVFEFFRECDRLGIRTIYCEAVPETGIGAALMDRLRRAAEG